MARPSRSHIEDLYKRLPNKARKLTSTKPRIPWCHRTTPAFGRTPLQNIAKATERKAQLKGYKQALKQARDAVMDQAS